MNTPLWINEPTILFDKDNILEMWPFENMKYNKKINAMTRMIIILTIIGLVITNSYYIVIVGLLALIIILYLSKRREELQNEENRESFLNKIKENDVQHIRKQLNTNFDKSSENNPFSNVLLTDINDNPEKKSAPPSYIKEVSDIIKQNIKKNDIQRNPYFKEKQENLWEEFQNDKMNHAFYSTANTRVTNDQNSFAQFLYGNMHSSKESNAEGAMMRTKNNSRYTLY